MRLILASVLLCLSIATTHAQHKVAILDDGYNQKRKNSFDVPASRIVDQRCISVDNQLINAPFDISLCENGQRTDLTGIRSAEHPVSVVIPTYVNNPQSVGGNDTSDNGIKLEHTWHVSDALYNFTRTASSIVNHQFFQVYSASWQHGDNANDEYYLHGSGNENIEKALNHLAYVADNTNLGAVSISLLFRPSNGSNVSAFCARNLGQGAVNRLYDLGIPVVVSFENEKIPHDEQTWPQCLDRVIKVGTGTHSQDNSEIGVGDNGGIDFFARSKINTTNGNSFAAPRIAGAYALLANADPYATVQAKTVALNGASTRESTYRVRVGGVQKSYTARYVQKSDMDEAIRLLDILNEDFNNDEAIAASDLDIQNNLEYGPYYGLTNVPFSINVDFSALRPVVSPAVFSSKFSATQSTPSLNGRRDVRLSFDGIFDDALFKTEQFNLYINNNFVTGFINFPDNSLVNRSYVVHRRFFSAGNNKIELRTASNTSPWGLTNFKMEFLPSINLQVGVKNTTEYGHEKNPDSRYTGMRANFSVPNAGSDYQLSLVGWDIDVADETMVYVNGSFVSHLTASSLGSSEYSPKDTFFIPRSTLRAGHNHIELVQREIGNDWTGFQDEKWAIKDLEVQVAKPDLFIRSFEITTRALKGSVPFNIKTIVRNGGDGSASATKINYYLSNDSAITTLDTIIGSAGVERLNPSQQTTINKSLITTEINKGKYISACIVSVPSELSTVNNCSNAIKLNSTVFPPITMFLLE